MQRSIPISEITVPHGRREPLKGRICSIARSISEVGLLNPIVVNEDYRLIAGRTRLEAVKSLGKKTIECTVIDVDDLHAELAEIDENVERNNLNALEEAQALARRKEIYLAMHPETAPVTERGGPGRGKTTDNLAVVSFAADTAEKTGKSERQVRRDVAIGENLTEAAAEAIKDTPLADNKAQLEQLSKLPEKEQVKAAKKIQAGKAKTVGEAAGKKASPADLAKKQVGIWADTIGRWLRTSPTIDEYRDQWPGEKGDRVVKAATELHEALKLWQKAIK